jgi:hypothetical protein
MSAAACKIILCGGYLLQAIADKMTASNEGAADRIIEWVEELTHRIETMD